MAATAKGGAAVTQGGIETANGIKITGFTKHGLNQSIGNFDRIGISPEGIVNALKNPLKIGEVKIDAFGRASQRFIGQQGTVAINPNTGMILSTNPTSKTMILKLLGSTGK